MATQLNQTQSRNSDKLPSQTVPNPANVSAITLRSGKQTAIPPLDPTVPHSGSPSESVQPEQQHHY